MDPALLGERVRSLRLLTGSTQEGLAEKAGVSQALLSSVESGRRVATDDLIERLMAVTGIPAAFFNRSPAPLSAGSLRWRKRAHASSVDTHRVEVLLREIYSIAVAMMAGAKSSAPALQPWYGPLDAAGIESAAAHARLQLGVDADSPLPHVTRILERGKIVVTPLALPGSDDEEVASTVGHMGASVWPDPDSLALIGYFPSAQGDRQRFTLSHELGHLMLHCGHGSVEDAEGEANRFAGAFLLPAERMTQAMEGRPVTLSELVHMKARWGVSIQAILMRGQHLGLIDKARFTSLYKQISARGYRTTEPVNVELEEPVLLRKLFDAQLGDLTWAKRGEKIGFWPTQLRGIVAA